MSIKIMVKDRMNRVAPRVNVRVKWKGGGMSSGRTDQNGQFDTGVNSKSTTEYVYVDDKDVGYGNVYIDNPNAVISFSINRSVG